MSDTTKPKATHGGARAGAGRKKSGRPVGGPHRRRPELSARHPVHVTMRLRKGFSDLRRRDLYRAIHRVLAHFLGRDDVRFVHASIQNTHLHLLVEARDRRALTRAMQSFAIRLAFALTGGFGKVFAFRYQAVAITSPRQARNTLAYVLNNWRRHLEDWAGGRQLAAPVDPYSSGITFDGWTAQPRFTLPQGYVPLPMSPPGTALLSRDWRRHGRIDPFERPGPVW